MAGYSLRGKYMKTLIRKSGITAIILSLSALFVGQAMAQPQIPMMKVTSNAFDSGSVIPIKYSSHGDDVQPDFTLTDAPDGTVAYAIIFHDIDVALGGTNDVLHWMAWNIPSPNIPEGSLPEGSVQGANITGANEYFGPGAPSPDKYHHYVFEFYALSTMLDLPASASRNELVEALNQPGVVVAKAAYVGRYANAQ
jgi:Raf kinase inhibitor-like YbhB/YbcL family protein